MFFLEALKSICYIFSHSSNAVRSCCSRSLSCWFLIGLKRSVSSANIRLFELLVASGRSLIYARNKSGQRTVPWGTPDRTSALDECQFSRSTCCFWSPMNKLIHLLVFPLTRSKLSLWSSQACRTLSNALAKSNRMMSTCLPFERFLALSWMVTISCLSHSMSYYVTISTASRKSAHVEGS